MRSTFAVRANRFFKVLLPLILFIVILSISLTQRETRARLRDGLPSLADPRSSAVERQSTAGQVQSDSLGDGFPDLLRLRNGQDRHSFVLWFTFLAEAAYYVPSKPVQQQVRDCAGLIRYAYRNALLPHTAAWWRNSALPFDPGFGDIAQLTSARRPTERATFRIRAGPLLPGAPGQGSFSQFADAATLLRYNAFFIAKDVRAARPGDLFFFHQESQREPFHTMLFVGNSHFQPQGTEWVVYHTGDLEGQRGEVREVEVEQLLGHPDPRWRPLATNHNFLGVYRLEILR